MWHTKAVLAKLRHDPPTSCPVPFLSVFFTHPPMHLDQLPFTKSHHHVLQNTKHIAVLFDLFWYHTLIFLRSELSSCWSRSISHGRPWVRLVCKTKPINIAADRFCFTYYPFFHTYKLGFTNPVVIRFLVCTMISEILNDYLHGIGKLICKDKATKL